MAIHCNLLGSKAELVSKPCPINALFDRDLQESQKVATVLAEKTSAATACKTKQDKIKQAKSCDVQVSKAFPKPTPITSIELWES
eukprot:1505959-Amphidinium_carterae.1